jgi:hypothetical protein
MLGSSSFRIQQVIQMRKFDRSCFKLPELGAEIDGPSINGAHDMNRGSLFYHAPVADKIKISVALCLVGEARESTFQQFNGMPCHLRGDDLLQLKNATQLQ